MHSEQIPATKLVHKHVPFNHCGKRQQKKLHYFPVSGNPVMHSTTSVVLDLYNTSILIGAYDYKQMVLYLSIGAPIINYVTINRGRQNLKICSK